MKLDTEIIDKLYLELSQFAKARTIRDIELDNLIMAVTNKYPGENRYQTALRYIKNGNGNLLFLTLEEIKVLRRWYNNIEDVNTGFLDEKDRDLYRKILFSLNNTANVRE